MKLSVLMPVFNEEHTVEESVHHILAQKFVFELIIINDGSTDGTATILKKIKKANPQKVTVLVKKNGGKGSAIKLGIEKAKGDYIIIQDADLEYDPNDITELIKPIKSGRAEVVYGSRFLGPHSNLLFWHRVGNSFLNLMINVLYNTTLSDMETCYKILPTKLLRELELCSDDFCLEPEITCKVLKRKIHIFEVPISYVGRDFSQGKKITWHHGFSAMATILRLRFTSN